VSQDVFHDIFHDTTYLIRHDTTICFTILYCMFHDMFDMYVDG
jgi:hypothetical protein